MIKKHKFLILLICLLFYKPGFTQNSDPVIGTVNVQQRNQSFLVDIYYDVTDVEGDPLIVYVQVSNDSGKTFTVPAQTFISVDYGFDIIPGLNKLITWDAGEDYPDQFGESFRVRLIASDINMDSVKNIVSGTFSMGDSSGLFDQQPRHDILLSEYSISPLAVTNAEYKIYCDLAGHAYPPEGGNSQPPAGYFVNYPNNSVVGISWYDAVRYCNWLSEQRGYSACYDTTDWSYDPAKNGYHLPTEAQWERAARGGIEKAPYPWGEGDPGTRCNYQSYQGLLVGEMADFSNGRGTLAVGKFNPNGFGLYDMAGNVWEWCNDWYQKNYYQNSPPENPLGPDTGSEKVVRGGAWNTSEFYLGCATRLSYTQDAKSYDIGFRIAR